MSQPQIESTNPELNEENTNSPTIEDPSHPATRGRSESGHELHMLIDTHRRGSHPPAAPAPPPPPPPPPAPSKAPTPPIFGILMNKETPTDETNNNISPRSASPRDPTKPKKRVSIVLERAPHDNDAEKQENQSEGNHLSVPTVVVQPGETPIETTPHVSADEDGTSSEVDPQIVLEQISDQVIKEELRELGIVASKHHNDESLKQESDHHGASAAFPEDEWGPVSHHQHITIPPSATSVEVVETQNEEQKGETFDSDSEDSSSSEEEEIEQNHQMQQDVVENKTQQKEQEVFPENEWGPVSHATTLRTATEPTPSTQNDESDEYSTSSSDSDGDGEQNQQQEELQQSIGAANVFEASSSFPEDEWGPVSHNSDSIVTTAATATNSRQNQQPQKEEEKVAQSYGVSAEESDSDEDSSDYSTSDDEISYIPPPPPSAGGAESSTLTLPSLTNDSTNANSPSQFSSSSSLHAKNFDDHASSHIVSAFAPLPPATTTISALDNQPHHHHNVSNPLHISATTTRRNSNENENEISTSNVPLYEGPNSSIDKSEQTLLDALNQLSETTTNANTNTKIEDDVGSVVGGLAVVSTPTLTTIGGGDTTTSISLPVVDSLGNPTSTSSMPFLAPVTRARSRSRLEMVLTVGKTNNTNGQPQLQTLNENAAQAAAVGEGERENLLSLSASRGGVSVPNSPPKMLMVGGGAPSVVVTSVESVLVQNQQQRPFSPPPVSMISSGRTSPLFISKPPFADHSQLELAKKLANEKQENLNEFKKKTFSEIEQRESDLSILNNLIKIVTNHEHQISQMHALHAEEIKNIESSHMSHVESMMIHHKKEVDDVRCEVDLLRSRLESCQNELEQQKKDSEMQKSAWQKEKDQIVEDLEDEKEDLRGVIERTVSELLETKDELQQAQAMLEQERNDREVECQEKDEEIEKLLDGLNEESTKLQQSNKNRREFLVGLLDLIGNEPEKQISKTDDSTQSEIEMLEFELQQIQEEVNCGKSEISGSGNSSDVPDDEKEREIQKLSELVGKAIRAQAIKQALTDHELQQTISKLHHILNEQASARHDSNERHEQVVAELGEQLERLKREKDEITRKSVASSYERDLEVQSYKEAMRKLVEVKNEEINALKETLAKIKAGGASRTP